MTSPSEKQQQQQQRTKAASTMSSSSLAQLIGEPGRANKPIGIRLFGICFQFRSVASKRRYHQALVLFMTFIAYTAFHMSRRPLSVVKNVLNRDCSRLPSKMNLSNEQIQSVNDAITAAATIYISDFPTQDNVISTYYEQQQQAHQETSTTLAPSQPTDHHNSMSTTSDYNNNNNNILNTDYDGDQVGTTTTSTTTSAPRALRINHNGQATWPATTPKPPPAKDTSCDWAPFNDDATANKLLAYLDTAFLLSYAIFMFFSGFVAERANLRYFITAGSLVSGLGLIAFGLSRSLDIHSMGYFVLVQVISGAAQTSGWPVVVTCVSNWFDRSKLGTIYGLWNSHTNLGNILGATIAGYFVESDWGLSFIVPGGLMLFVGLVLLLFLVPTPADVGLESRERLESLAPQQGSRPMRTSASSGDSTTKRAQFVLGDGSTAAHTTTTHVNHEGGAGKERTIAAAAAAAGAIASSADSINSNNNNNNKPISFTKALRIPGVLEYSFCLFFSKLVSYTFLYWLPRYITASTKFNSQDSAYLSTPFDVGGIAGSILAGWLSDRFKANGIICNVMLLLAIPSMFAYQHFGALSSLNNILLQLLVGSLVNGPYCLITTAVSADLGTRISDGHAMATVSAIIDGMGSLGAVLGPLFAGFVSSSDWRSVFLMLMLADVLASLCIIRITVADVRARLRGPEAAASLATTTTKQQQQPVA